MVQSNLIALIPLFPILAVLVNGFSVWSRRELSKTTSGLIACCAVLLSAITATILFFKLLGLQEESKFYQELFSWINSGQGNSLINIQFAFVFDRLSAVMALTVCWVGFLIHVYSIGYMEHDPSVGRYFTYLNLFMFAMLLLVLGSNLLVLFIGWEGVGLCSYLLIGFWFEDDEKASAGKKAFIVNRIGDFGFLLGIFFLCYGMAKIGTMSLEYSALRESVNKLSEMSVTFPIFGNVGLLEVIGISLFIGATGKSAQIPLYIWLPDAMAGPTPVSALIHAATMVTAGVYMIARMGFLYTLAPFASTLVALIGGITALFAATIGLAQNDIKKVLAYSTVSQLGYMFIGVGVGAYSAGIFHLVTHAFFKACLFMGSGAVILACHHEQDIRRMGGLLKKMKWTGITFVLATLCIAGLPPFSGFVSKDEILWMAYSTPNTLYPTIHKFIWFLGMCGAFCTAFYMTRLTLLTFFGEYRGAEHNHDFHHEMPYDKVHEVRKVMWVPLVILMIGFCTLGFLGKSKIFSGGNKFHHWLAPVTDSAPHSNEHTKAKDEKHHEEISVSENQIKKDFDTGTTKKAGFPDINKEDMRSKEETLSKKELINHQTGNTNSQEDEKELEHMLMGFSVLVAFLGVSFAYFLYGKRKLRPPKPSEEKSLKITHRMLLNKYWVDEIYQAIVVNPIRLTSDKFLWKIFDVKLIDGTVNGIAYIARGLSSAGLRLQNGMVNTYAFYMVIGVAVVMGYMIFG